MAYWTGLFTSIEQWFDAGILPTPSPGDRIAELGSQMIVRTVPTRAIAQFIQRFRPDFDEAKLAASLPLNPYGVAYVGDMWHLCGLDYISYDVTEAPRSRVFDLNFHDVPAADQQSAIIVTNIGTTEHVANQLNAFRTIHDLLKVGGVALHSVPFTGMLNHALFNYHPKFFFSLIVNNRYRLRHAEFAPPNPHTDMDLGNTVFESDYLPAHPKLPGSQAWSDTKLDSGIINLVIERRYGDPFVPPVDFAGGYFGDIGSGDLSALVGVDDFPTSAWADAYRRGTTPTQQGPADQVIS
jgi:hypothetical protein